MNIITFKIDGYHNDSAVTLYPSLIQISGRNYLVDCGYEETFPQFVNQLAIIGIALTDIHAIVISHDDIDHLGALRLFKDNHPNLMVYSSAIEAESVAGNIKSERLQQAEASLSQVPETYKEWALKFIAELNQIKRVPVDGVLNDNDSIEAAIRIISTPGHTKGHLSFYAPIQRVLIASDAVVLEDGHLSIANPEFTLDLPQAVQSVKKLAGLSIEKLICYHGGILQSDVAQHLSALLAKYSAND